MRRKTGAQKTGNTMNKAFFLDRDGVIVIPSGDAASLYDAARQSHERDLAKTENARRGLFDRGWVDGALERKGCEIVEGPWR